jgi:hypothetical protein
MKFYHTTITTILIATITLPSIAFAAVDVDPHTNIPDTDQYVTHELSGFVDYVKKSDRTNEELVGAMSDLDSLLQTYTKILSRRSN